MGRRGRTFERGRHGYRSRESDGGGRESGGETEQTPTVGRETVIWYMNKHLVADGLYDEDGGR